MTRLRWRGVLHCLGVPRWWIRQEAQAARDWSEHRAPDCEQCRKVAAMFARIRANRGRRP